MTLQNRVNPLGEIEAIKSRGMFMGNRGILHDANKELGKRRWTHKNWVCCTLHYKDTQRTIMAPGKYTELFFLDEATALAAGHRPCATCRKTAYEKFMALWREANDIPDASPKDVDTVLHKERAAVIGLYSLTETHYDDIPDGCFFRCPRSSSVFLKMADGIHQWSCSGYGRVVILEGGPAIMITPPSIARVIAAGYTPEFHESVVPPRVSRFVWESGDLTVIDGSDEDGN